MRDVLVIGSGVIGALVASEMVTGDAALDVELVDKDAKPGGASAYAGAIDSPYSWTSAHADLQHASWRWHESQQDTTASYRQRLRLHWLGRDGDSETLADVVRGTVTQGIVPQGYEATKCLISDAYVIDPLRLIDHCIARGKQSGVTVTYNRRLISLTPAERYVEALFDDGEVCRARHAVVAVGPWIIKLANGRLDTTSCGLKVKRVYGVRIETSSVSSRDRGWADPDRGLFLFPRLNDRTWAMSIKHAVWDVDPDVLQPSDTTLITLAVPLLDAVFGAGEWRISSYATFADTYTRDRSPVVASAMNGLATVISGTHGSGVRLAPALAAQAIELVRRSLA